MKKVFWAGIFAAMILGLTACEKSPGVLPEIEGGKYTAITNGKYVLKAEIFDERDNPIFRREKTDEDYDDYYIAYMYDNDGNILEERENFNGSLKYRTAYEYENGSPVKVTKYDYHNDKPVEVKTYIYDEHGEKISAKCENPQRDAVVWEYGYEYEYDDNGRWLSRKTYDIEADCPLCTEICERDDKGNILRSTEEYPDRTTANEYSFDENGNETKFYARSVYNDDGTVSEFTRETEYDDSGRKVRESIRSTSAGTEIDDKQIDYKYKYK